MCCLYAYLSCVDYIDVEQGLLIAGINSVLVNVCECSIA